MFGIKDSVKCLWLLLLIWVICLANARQIRYSRYDTEVIEDSEDSRNGTNVADNQTLDDENEIQATVREVKLAPYPASGYRPSRAFPLPNEATTPNEQSDIEAQVTAETPIVTTTETIDLATTTQGAEIEATTMANHIQEDNTENDVLSQPNKPVIKRPYPPAGFKPKIPFLLPTDNSPKSRQLQDRPEIVTEMLDNSNTTELPVDNKVKAPYPPAGYRPSKAFLLPSEQLLLENESNNTQDANTDNNNSHHPICGSSTDPLAPKPLDADSEDPNSESIYTNPPNERKSQQQRAVVIPVRLSVHPLLLPQPLFYTAPIPAL